MPSHAMPSVMAVAAVTSVRKCAPIISREKATTAVHTAPTASPASTTTFGENDRIRHRPSISRIDSVEKMNANSEVA